MAYTLAIPRRRDPVASAVLLTCLVGAAWMSLAQPGSAPAAQAQAEPVVLIVTPTLPALAYVVDPPPAAEQPTIARDPTAAPAVAELAAPTPAPEIVYVQSPPEIIYVQSKQPVLTDLSQDPNAAPACAPGADAAYCGLPVGQAEPQPPAAFEPMTAEQEQYSRARTR